MNDINLQWIFDNQENKSLRLEVKYGRD